MNNLDNTVAGKMVTRSIIKKLYCLYDCVSETYGPPMLHYTRGEAIRVFSDAAASPDAAISKHPEQYTLFEFGEFDLVSGSFLIYDAKVAVINGLDTVRQ